MTVDGEALVRANAGAKDVAESVLAGAGATSRQIAVAVFRDASTELPQFGVPSDCDYHGYEPDQGLPAWVRVYELTDSVAEQLCGDHEQHPEVRALVVSGQYTHRVRIVGASQRAQWAALLAGIEETIRSQGWDIILIEDL